MKILSLVQLGILKDIEDKYNCDFYLPPFNKKIDCCFFNIDKIQHNAIKFRKFLIEIKSAAVSHKFININGKKYMAVMVEK